MLSNKFSQTSRLISKIGLYLSMFSVISCGQPTPHYNITSSLQSFDSNIAAQNMKKQSEEDEKLAEGRVPRNFRQIVDRELSEKLVDPDSRKVEFTRNPGGGAVCGLINSKNRMGGYAGRGPFYVIFDRNEKIRSATIFDNGDVNAFRNSTRLSDPGYRYYIIFRNCGFI
jgi:hypothetical protein